MKRSPWALSILPVMLLASCALTSSPGKQEGGTTSEQSTMDESHMKGVVMEGGTMMTIWDDDSTEAMEEDLHLKNGMAIMMDGSVTMADGRTVRLHDGDAMMMDGAMKKASELHLKSMMKEDDAKDAAKMMAKGEYEDYTAQGLPASELKDGKTKVLYFFAAWCPVCKKTNGTLTSWYADGDGLLSVYKVNYDAESALKQRYGVTYQHTFVKVDGEGNALKVLQGPTDQELHDFLKI